MNAHKLRNELLLPVAYQWYNAQTVVNISFILQFAYVKWQHTNNTCIAFQKYEQSYVVTLHYYFV